MIVNEPVVRLTRDLKAIAVILASKSRYSMLREIQNIDNDPELLNYLFKVRCGFSATLPPKYKTIIKVKTIAETFPLSRILSETRASVERQLVELEVLEDKINIIIALSLLAPVILVISLLLYSVPVHITLVIMSAILAVPALYAYRVLGIPSRKFLKDTFVLSLACLILLLLGLLLRPQVLLALLIISGIIEKKIRRNSNNFDMIRYYERACLKLIYRLNIIECPYSVLSSLIDIKEGEWQRALKLLFAMRNGRTLEPRNGIILPYAYTILYKSIVKAKDNMHCFLSAIHELKRLNEKWKAKLKALRLRLWALGLSTGFTLGVALGLIKSANVGPYMLIALPILVATSISNFIFGREFATRYCVVASLAVSVAYYIVKSLI